jgi:plastocyanin
MSNRRAITAMTVVALGGVAAVVPAAAGSAPKVIKKVTVEDDFYGPSRLKLTKGAEVKWQWKKTNLDSHNVTLVKGPKGIKAKAWTSATGSSGIVFNRTFTKPGTYHFQCTIHPASMNLTIVVKG